jgi:hypothetical protein
MKQILVDHLIEELGMKELYPITIIKFLINRRAILNYFEKISSSTYKESYIYDLNIADCKWCNEKESSGVLCRNHTSIHRVLNAPEVAYDLDTNTYFYKNEIFRMIGNKLVIFYAPHPKLISGKITDDKVRKINRLVVEDPDLQQLPPFKSIYNFISSNMLDQYLKCWFNDEFSLLTIPYVRYGQNWALIPNK